MKKYLAFLIVVAVLLAGFILIKPKSEPVEENMPPVSGKIDINAVCEGALAYMTFENAGDAELFVAGCKEGQYPEVIEQWKAMNGISDDKAI